MLRWNARAVLVIALLLAGSALGAEEARIADSRIDVPEPGVEPVAELTVEPGCEPATQDGSFALEDPLAGDHAPRPVTFCSGQKQYDCTWPQSNCVTAIDSPGIDCSTIGKVCGRVYYYDSNDDCCSTQGAYECIDSGSCTPGGWWSSCNNLCGPCELP